jgi:hypothetical protein
VSHCFPVPPDTGRGHQLLGITARQGLLLDFDPRCRLSARYLARVPRSCVPSVEAIAIRWQKFAVLSHPPRGKVNARPVMPADRLPPESPASSNFRCAHATARQRSSVSHTRQVDHRRRWAASCAAEAAVGVGVNILLPGYPGFPGPTPRATGRGWLLLGSMGTRARIGNRRHCPIRERRAEPARAPGSGRVPLREPYPIGGGPGGNTPGPPSAAIGAFERAGITDGYRPRGAGFSPCTRGRKLNRKPWPG